MFAALTKQKKVAPKATDAVSFDPNAKVEKQYIEDSGALGPTLSPDALLFSAEPIKIVDIVAIAGRIQSLNDIADWKNLPSTKLEGIVDKENPPMWLPRETFKTNIRQLNFKSWPVDPSTGEPVGGEELKKAELKRVQKKGALIGDAALDAFFDTWAWGANIATPDKVEPQLAQFAQVKGRDNILDMGKFSSSVIRGRSITILAALTFLVIQFVVFASLFLSPALRVFFDIDIGLGQLGSCGVNGCTTLF